MVLKRGKVNSHFPMKSSDKGTPGIEFDITLTEEQVKLAPDSTGKPQVRWDSCDTVEATANVWFSGGRGTEMALKKLRHAGWEGNGGIASLNLVGSVVEIEERTEYYEGKEIPKHEFPLPPRKTSQPSDEARNAIDAIMQSAPVAAGSPAVAPVASTSSIPDDEVPF